MSGTVPILSMIFMFLAGLSSIVLPILLFLWFKLKMKADILPFFVGCAVMLVFAFVLEASVHQVVLMHSPVGETIRGNTWLYALYGGLMAGLFEESGRFIAFRKGLKSRLNKDANALMYGAGHGGIEAVVVLGITNLNNLIYSVLINTGNTKILTGPLTGDLKAQVETAIQALITTPSYLFLLGMVERIFAISLHIALSVLVWFAVKYAKEGKGYLFPLAIFLHFFVDACTAGLAGLGVNTLLIEAFVGALTLVAVIIAKRVWVSNSSSDIGIESE